MTNTKIIQWKRISLEAAAIVVGILLAFSIDAWCNDKQESLQKERMVAALIVDFERTREALLGSIEEVEARMADATKLLTLSNDNETPVEDLRRLFFNSISAELFRPSMTTYNSGVATGKLDMLETPDLQKAFSDFLYWWQGYTQTADMTMDVFFRGSAWDVRRSVGKLAILYREPAELPARFRLSESEYRELLGRNEVHALIDNMRDLHANKLWAFRGMEAAAGTILIELEKQ